MAATELERFPVRALRGGGADGRAGGASRAVRAPPPGLDAGQPRPPRSERVLG